MMRVKLVVILGAAMLSKLAFAEGNEVIDPAVLELTRRSNSAVVVLRASAEDVFLPTCRGVVWERFVEPEGSNPGRYVSLVEEACGVSKPPIKVTKDGMEFIAPPHPEGKSMVVRAVAVIGVGCTSDQPMALGGCSSVTSLISSNITISAVKPD